MKQSMDASLSVFLHKPPPFNIILSRHYCPVMLAPLSCTPLLLILMTI